MMLSTEVDFLVNVDNPLITVTLNGIMGFRGSSESIFLVAEV